MVIYVGDARDVVRRICSDHSSNNVEGSSLRRHIAEYRRWQLKKTKRPSGSTRVRIDLPDPLSAEREISYYIQSGQWRYVICVTYGEANDFQWYAIEKLDSLLNVDRRQWNRLNQERYEVLLQRLLAQQFADRQQILGRATGPGVYVFYHDHAPNHRFKRTWAPRSGPDAA